jgi:hypothetical protein
MPGRQSPSIARFSMHRSCWEGSAATSSARQFSATTRHSAAPGSRAS